MSIQPINVFISSCMKTDELKKLRSDIAESLDKIPLFNAYLFEGHGASSLPAEIDFQLAAEQADVCVFVVEDAFGVTDAMQKEIDAARRGGGKCLYYFLDNDNSRNISLRKELRNGDCPTSYDFKSFEELPQRVLSDLLLDVGRVYRQLGKGFSYNRLLGDGADLLADDPSWDDAIVGNDLVANYPKTKAFLARFVFGIEESNAVTAREVAIELGIEPPTTKAVDEEMDLCCANLLEVVLGSRTMRELNVALLYEQIDAHLPDSYANVSKARWRAIQSFYLGDSKVAMDRMREALDIAESNKVAGWLVDDILIDLRNLDVELNGMNGIMGEYQKRLGERDKPLVYPVADRLGADMLAALVDDSYKKSLQTADTVTIGEDVTRFLNGLAGMIIVSVLYGSYSYIRLIPTRLRRVVYVVNLRHSSPLLQRVILVLALIDGKSKEARKLFNVYGGMLSGLSALDAESMYRFVCDCSVGVNRDIALLEAFSILGSYLSDEAFVEALADVRGIVDRRLRESVYPEATLASLRNNAARIEDKAWLASVCEAALEKGPSTLWCDEGMKMLAAGSVHLADIDQVKAGKLIGIVESCVLESTALGSIAMALLQLREHEGFAGRIDQIAETLPDYARVDYVINCPGCSFADMESVAERSIARIVSDNDSQGKDGAYSYGSNDYLSFEYAAESTESQLPDDTLVRAAEACFGTLRSEGQLLAAKYNALRLLVYLSGESRAVFELAVSELRKIEFKDGDLNRGALFGGPYESRLVRTCLFALKAAVLGEDGAGLRIAISSMRRANEFCQMKFASFIGRMARSGLLAHVSAVSSSRLVSFLQFVALEEPREARLAAYRALSELLGDAIFGEEIAELFRVSFAGAEPHVKHVVLNAVGAYPELFGDETSFIIGLARRDVNYYVREHAAKVIEGTVC